MKIKHQRFSDQRFVIAGMGQAGTGIASNIRAMLMEEGLSESDAGRRIFAFDAPGLLMEDTPGLEEQQRRFAQPRLAVAGWKSDSAGPMSLLDLVRNAKATVLIGVTARTGLFSAEVLMQMGKNDERPIIFALSNPTSKSECTPDQAAAATGGRAIIATGSPFPPVEYGGKTFATSQCNNMFVFPGMGLGALVSRSSRITPKMFLKASRALSDLVSEEQRSQRMLLPTLNDIRKVSAHVAKAVAIEARDSGLGRHVSDDEYARLICKAQWSPHYYPFRRPNGK